MSNIKQLSRNDYNKSRELITESELQIGCLQRIADATEKMAVHYDDLLKAKKSAEADRDRYKQYWHEEKERKWKAQRQISALRGVITKLKKKEANHE